jgi:GntR family transcriptional regulator/MocR family aminotransferase
MPLQTLLNDLGGAGKKAGRSRQQRLYDLLRRAILDGVLPQGWSLPGSREMARGLGLSRNTVIYAFELLRAEGFVLSDRRGTRVATLTLAAPQERTGNGTEPLKLSVRGQQMGIERHGGEHLPFAAGVPDVNLFPWRQWFKHLEHAWKSVGARHLAYAPIGGERRLREAIAMQLGITRGISCTADQVLVTSGAQTAIDVCGRLLADQGDVAWIETPGYPSARAILGASGLKLVDVPVDADGMAASPALWRCHPPKLILVTPSHQYPMGGVMPLERRIQLLGHAQRHQSWIVEDDYDCDLQHTGAVIPAIQSLAAQSAVVYVGTFSKSLYPGLRIGYLVLPAWICKRFSEAVQPLFTPGQALEQLALARFMESGDLARHLRRMRGVYRERQQCMRDQLEQHFGDRVRILGGNAGVHLTCVFAPGTDDVAIARRAATLGVTARPLSGYGSQGVNRTPIPGLVLGYGVADVQQIRQLIPRLRQAYDDLIHPQAAAMR